MASYDNAGFRRGKKAQPSTQQPTLNDPAGENSPPSRPVRRRTIGAIVVTALAGGLVATLAIPAFAFAPGATEPRHSATTVAEPAPPKAQTAGVPTPATTITFERAGAGATAPGTSTASVGAITPIRTFQITSVFAAAARYQGVPYVFGGASPRGFDCSGLVKYVWAKYGKNLPHSSNAQARMGKRISRAAARPGDLVVLPGHIGFYAGKGRILHAPYPGQRVRIQPIWTNNYYIVRL